MSRTPTTEQAYIAFARQHLTIWEGNGGQPPMIGLSSLQLQETSDAVDAAEAAYAAALAARDASKAATQAKDNALAALQAVIGGDIDTIDAFAKATKNPNVWVLAQIPAPKDPSERPAPPAPTDLRAVVDSDGSVNLTFKVATGGGATYLVQRLITPLEGAPNAYEFLGFANDNKTFTDNAVPEGVKSVGYRVAARLATGPMSSWSQTLIIPFGSQDNGPVGSIAPANPEDQKAAG